MWEVIHQICTAIVALELLLLVIVMIAAVRESKKEQNHKVYTCAITDEHCLYENPTGNCDECPVIKERS